MTFIIAEIGINHNGDMQQAKRLIYEAKQSGANAAKFQLFSSRRLWGDDRIKHYELSYVQLLELKEVCDHEEIEFMCTPFDVEAVQFLAPLVNYMKVGSGCRKIEILEAIERTGLPVFLSTGMAEYADIDEAIDYLVGNDDITLLHCVSSYPCLPQDVNLKAMISLQQEYNLEVGYSDHTEGILAPVIAVSLGATVIEKHITLNRNAKSLLNHMILSAWWNRFGKQRFY